MNFETRVKYDSESNIKRALKSISIYCVFIVMTTVVAVSARHHYMYFFNNAIKRHFVIYERHVTYNEWWSALAEVYVPLVLDTGNGLSSNNNDNSNNTTDNRSTKRSAAHGTEEEIKILQENTLLGTPRMRQIRVDQSDCVGPKSLVKHFHNICYPEYSYLVQKTSGEHIGTEFRSSAELGTMPLTGRMHTYYGGGFVQSLDRNLDESLSLIDSLAQLEWLDRGTRLMIFEFTLFNRNTDLFNNVKIIGEVPETGGVILYLRVQTVQKHAVWTGSIWIILSAIVFYLMALYYLVGEILELKRRGRKAYFKNFWNLVDINILLLVFISFSYNIFHPVYLHYYMKEALVKHTEYHSLDLICWLNTHYMNLVAVLAFLVWFKIFQFFTFNKTSLQLNATFVKCYRDLLSFVLIFIILFFSYAILGMLLFGHTHEDFFVFPIAFWSVMRMVLSDFDYVGVEQANRVLGPIYFFSFILIVYFILINMFLAIIFDTFHDIKKYEIPSEHKQLPQFFRKYWDKSRDGGRRALNAIGLCKRGKQTRKNIEPVREMQSDNEPPFPPVPKPEKKVRVSKKELLRDYFETVENKEDAVQIERLTKHINALEGLLAKMSDDIKRLEAETSDPSTRPEPPTQPKAPPRLKVFINRKK
ncbi:polycystic kidney disease 2-like 2 protein [Ceratitis capitata]|uniref:polycystic kidney disease 2-like 2 protein n=1 Tax=Ceratitis capitata TaxID=7213 RepID=UPI0006188E17|nr:polycystic kidney disease 2-like 2 protein [Ceratitis capitata]